MESIQNVKAMSIEKYHAVTRGICACKDIFDNDNFTLDDITEDASSVCFKITYQCVDDMGYADGYNTFMISYPKFNGYLFLLPTMQEYEENDNRNYYYINCDYYFNRCSCVLHDIFESVQFDGQDWILE